MGGVIIYICSKNSVFAGPNNVAYGAAKADQAHQVRLLAAELGEAGIRVNGINPDGVVRGSGIFAGGWGAQRAAVYGVAEEELGTFYAQRTLLKREVLPEHVAAAVVALTTGDLALTTGLHIPVDAGVAAAFLRLGIRDGARSSSRGRPRGVRRPGDGGPGRGRPAGAARGAPVPERPGHRGGHAALGHPAAAPRGAGRAARRGPHLRPGRAGDRLVGSGLRAAR